MEDYNRKKAINVSKNEKVKTIMMGDYMILDDLSKEHLVTWGISSCVGVAIVVKTTNGKIIRLLAHIDMGEIIGISIDSFKYVLKRIKPINLNEVENIEISLTSMLTYSNMQKLKEKEEKLLAIILKEFKEFGIKLENIKINKGMQVQISPSGVISTYSEKEVEKQNQNILEQSISSFGGYIDYDLNIYITQYGGYMGDYISLGINCSEEEKTNALKSEYWQQYINSGYKLKIAPSFNNPNCMAVYVENWKDKKIHKYGTIKGCVRVESEIFDEHKEELAKKIAKIVQENKKREKTNSKSSSKVTTVMEKFYHQFIETCNFKGPKGKKR